MCRACTVHAFTPNKSLQTLQQCLREALAQSSISHLYCKAGDPKFQVSEIDSVLVAFHIVEVSIVPAVVAIRFLLVPLSGDKVGSNTNQSIQRDPSTLLEQVHLFGLCYLNRRHSDQ